MMSRGFRKQGSFGMSAKGHSETPDLNLTPMIDMMVVLMIFLVKVYSTDPAYLTNSQNIELSQTTSETVAPNAPVLMVGKDGVMVEGKVVIKMENGEIAKSAFAKNGTLPELEKVLIEMAERTKAISEQNPSVQFTGSLILQADKNVPFDAIRPILKTAGLAGFHDFKFAGIYPN